MSTAVSTKVANPFATATTQNNNAVASSNAGFGQITQNNSANTAIAATAEVAQMQARIFLAKQFPRDPQKCVDKILTQFQRESLASISMYQYSRGGTDICDLSIRALEAIALDWGNIDSNWSEIDRGYDYSVCEAYAWDLETNVKKSIKFTVPHYRTTKKGRFKLEDERDIYELCANMASRRIRACMQAVVPRDVQDCIKEQINTTLKANVDCSPARIKKMLEHFKSKYGVTKAQIEKRIQRNIESITPAQMVALINITNSLADGMSSTADWFESVEDGKADKKKTLADMAAANEAPATTTEEAPEPKEELL